MKKVGFLSTQDSPLLPHFVYSSKKLGLNQITLIVVDSALTTNFGLPQDDKSARTWLLIPDSKLEQVRRKVAEGRYKYQRL